MALLFAVRPAAAMDSLLVFAAASTQPVVNALIPVLKSHGITVTAVFASSATLARQIEQGGHVDAYITAHGKWMDYLEGLNLIQPGTRQNVAINRLALISGQDIDLTRVIKSIASALDGGRLAIANPQSVPAGLYAKQALLNTGQWAALKDHLAPAKDVTGALMLVARGEVPLGIVYASDVKRSSDIKASALFPNDSHDPIVYQVAGITGAKSPALDQFLAVLSGPEGAAAFQDAGFGPIKP
ncbi:MAG: molybdate ABC transporter substrate-binding protein [Magnetovibrio sp.]|nr:molybdate ABC transporter substrate-binding protein [Magnetovibrio sp.]